MPTFEEFRDVFEKLEAVKPKEYTDHLYASDFTLAYLKLLIPSESFGSPNTVPGIRTYSGIKLYSDNTLPKFIIKHPNGKLFSIAPKSMQNL